MRRYVLSVFCQLFCISVLIAKPLQKFDTGNTKPRERVNRKVENQRKEKQDEVALPFQKKEMHKPDVRKNFKKVTLPTRKPAAEKYSPQKNKKEWNVKPTKLERVVPASAQKI